MKTRQNKLAIQLRIEKMQQKRWYTTFKRNCKYLQVAIAYALTQD